MPELPEVETVVRTLENEIRDLQIKKIDIYYPKMIEGNVQIFTDTLVNEHFRRFNRRGKYLLFYMDHVLLACHLRMEGKFYYVDASVPRDKHTHVVFTLSNGKKLMYHDTRKFGRMEIYPLDVDMNTFHHLGPEPFDEAFNAKYVYTYCKNRKISIKTLLLKQEFVAGIGNIYADEILFACGIRPGRSTKYITLKDAENIVMQTRNVLQKAILAGGTTIRSYTSSLGVTGKFQLSCNVHAQKNCRVCNKPVKVKWIGGRSSYYCPQCQKR